MKSQMPDPAVITKSLLAFVNNNIMARSRQIGAGEDLKAAGIDSMAMLKILVFIETEFGIWMPAEDLAVHNLSTLQSLSTYIAQQGHGNR